MSIKWMILFINGRVLPLVAFISTTGPSTVEPPPPILVVMLNFNVKLKLFVFIRRQCPNYLLYIHNYVRDL